MLLSPIKHAACLLDETTCDLSCTCRQVVNPYPLQVKGYSSLGKTSLWPSSNRCRKGRPYSHLCTFFQVTYPQHSGVSDSGLDVCDHGNALWVLKDDLAPPWLQSISCAEGGQLPLLRCLPSSVQHMMATSTSVHQHVSNKQGINVHHVGHPVASGFNCSITTTCAGKKAASGQEQMGQVQISTAFQSPDLLQSCLAFLRQYATDTGSHAACAVVPKQSIAYPQVLLRNLSVRLLEQAD